MNVYAPPPNIKGMEKKLENIQLSLGKEKWWENTWVQILIVLGALGGILAIIFVFVPPASFGNHLWIWVTVLAALVTGFGIAKILNYPRETLVFVHDELQSFWHLAPQPDGRQLTQISLRGHVTNVSTKPLYLVKIDLVSPKAKTEPSKFIFPVRNNAVDSDHPIMPDERTEFSGHLFAQGCIGTVGESLTMMVDITDNLGKKHKVKFTNLRSVST